MTFCSRFLGDMVKRLSEELARRLASDPQAVAQQLGPNWRDEGAELMDDVVLPPWLSDARWGWCCVWWEVEVPRVRMGFMREGCSVFRVTVISGSGFGSDFQLGLSC
jgi:hypothetical protein